MDDNTASPATSEEALAAKILARLKRRLVLWYVLSLLVAAAIGGSLAWREGRLQALSNARIAEYRHLLAEKLGELHRLDLDVARYRTRVQAPCARPLGSEAAARLLAEHTGAEPVSTQAAALLESAREFNICDPARVRRIWSDAPNLARVDTVFRLVLKRPSDPVGSFIYGHWLASGMDLDAIARDLIASPEFRSVRDADSLQTAVREVQEQGLSEYRVLVADRLEELHALDLEWASRRTRSARDCAEPLPRDEAASLLTSELGWAPRESEVDQLIAQANEFGLCDRASVELVYADRASMAAIDTLYRVLLRRPSDPFGRLIYGRWIASGLPIEAAARDIMSSSEFQKLRKLGEP